jgi:hypothetical protein
MTVNLSMLAGAGAQFFDNNGDPLSGGKVFTYAAGTTTPQATYTTNAGNVAHANPIVLDSAGRVPSGGEIWLTDAVSYKFVLANSAGTTIATYDNITGNGSVVLPLLAASNGSALIGFIQDGAGTVSRTVESTLRDIVHVKGFGAVCDGIADDTSAINAFFTYAQSNKCHAVMEGNFKVTSAITSTGGAGSTFYFNAVITAANTMDWVIKFVDHSGVYFAGDLEVYGAGSNPYANRLCKDGMVFENCRGANFEKIRAERFLRFGVQVTATGNNTLLNLGDVRTFYCGSSISADHRSSHSYTGKINTGSASAAAQRSEITLSSVPANLAVNMLAVVGGEPYIVTAISGTNVTVYPWIKSTSATGTIDFFIGAGVKIEGDDAASVNLNSVDSTYSAVGIHSASLYGFKAKRLVSQLNGIGVVAGNNTASTYYGNTLESFYTEGNTFDIVKTTSGGVGLTINGMYEFAPEKFYQLSPRLASYEYDGLYIALSSVLINTGGKQYSRIQATNGLGGYSASYAVTADNSVIPIKGGNSISISLAFDAGNDRNFGHNHLTFIVYGRRAGSRVDSITFTPANPAFTVMGAASYVISGVTTVMLVTAWFDFEASNWVINKQELSTRLTGSATYDPPSLADGAGATTTVTVTGAILGDYAVASFSRDLQGINVTAYVSAADTVSVRFQNETGGTIDLASGTLRAFVTKL